MYLKGSGNVPWADWLPRLSYYNRKKKNNKKTKQNVAFFIFLLTPYGTSIMEKGDIGELLIAICIIYTLTIPKNLNMRLWGSFYMQNTHKILSTVTMINNCAAHLVVIMWIALLNQFLLNDYSSLPKLVLRNCNILSSNNNFNISGTQ